MGSNVTRTIKILVGMDNEVLLRPFITTAAGYMENIKLNYESVDPKYFKKVYLAEWPHFVWIIEITTKKMLEGDRSQGFGHIVLNATASANRVGDAIMGVYFGTKPFYKLMLCKELNITSNRTLAKATTETFPLMTRNLKK